MACKRFQAGMRSSVFMTSSRIPMGRAFQVCGGRNFHRIGLVRPAFFPATTRKAPGQRSKGFRPLSSALASRLGVGGGGGFFRCVHGAVVRAMSVGRIPLAVDKPGRGAPFPRLMKKARGAC
jgi:hypothetical protein